MVTEHNRRKGQSVILEIGGGESLANSLSIHSETTNLIVKSWIQ